MFRSDNREVTAIQSGDDLDPESFGKCYDGCVNRPERQIVIAGDELRDPHPIARENRRSREISGGEIAEEAHFCFPSEAGFDEVRDLGDDELGDE